MQSSHHDPVSYFKKLEEEMNKTIHARTNCRSFTTAFGRALDAHLKQMRIHKRLTSRWLNRLDMPNKDELAAISVRIVDCEEKLDFLDEAIYFLNQKQHENSLKVKMVRSAFDELYIMIEKELREMHDCKMKGLEKDLWELKQLFITETE